MGFPCDDEQEQSPLKGGKTGQQIAIRIQMQDVDAVSLHQRGHLPTTVL
ncbi:TPA: hypothetical protein G8431_003566 [Salmonella enterica]|uniref:Uncharacterized protein n=1 Tax=Salmonella enterica TaxID=28901 RepID=A0A763MVA9_SALER|nr:hypothetical protein [Salmonella enterica]